MIFIWFMDTKFDNGFAWCYIITQRRRVIIPDTNVWKKEKKNCSGS